MAFHVACRTIMVEDGLRGMYRGFVPNALKNLPNKGACAGAWGVAVAGAVRFADVWQLWRSRRCCRLCGTPAQCPHPLTMCVAGVKLSVFDGAKKLLTKAEAAYDEECVLSGVTPPVRQEWAGRGRNGNGNGGKGGKQQPPRK